MYLFGNIRFEVGDAGNRECHSAYNIKSGVEAMIDRNKENDSCALTVTQANGSERTRYFDSFGEACDAALRSLK